MESPLVILLRGALKKEHVRNSIWNLVVDL